MVQSMLYDFVIPVPLKGIQRTGPSVSFGGAGSYATFHNHSEAWLASVFGRKMWALSKDEPSSLDQSASPCDLRASNHIKVCVVHPGEVIFVPDAWYHAICNLDS